MGDYGEFEEVVDVEPGKPGVAPVDGENVPARARVPRKGEVIGIILQRYGGNRMEVQGTDGKKRNCRVPGRFKRALWLRPKDIVLVVPWVDDDEKADIVFKYTPAAVNQLRKKGVLDSLKEGF
ncbi:MAG: translation initiation factor eIF-1A [archaeon]